jgi:hypothetical protein
VVDLFITRFIFSFGIGLGARVAPVKPDQERNERGQDGDYSSSHGFGVLGLTTQVSHVDWVEWRWKMTNDEARMTKE